MKTAYNIICEIVESVPSIYWPCFPKDTYVEIHQVFRKRDQEILNRLMKKDLTKRQNQVLDSIYRAYRINGVVPSIFQLAKADECTATNMSQLVGKIIQKGYVKKNMRGMLEITSVEHENEL